MNPNTVYNQKKVVRVTYENEDIFKIPSNIDLENKDQVEEWWVKYNTLHIMLKGEEVMIEIESEGWERDEKNPTSETIEDAEDFGVEDEDFDKVDMKTGKICKIAEEECSMCRNIYNDETFCKEWIPYCLGCMEKVFGEAWAKDKIIIKR